MFRFPSFLFWHTFDERKTIGKDSDVVTLYDLFWVQVISHYSIDNGIYNKKTQFRSSLI